MIASGGIFGPDQTVALQLLEITPALDAVKGVVMELDDCAFPLLQDVIYTDDANVAFKDTDYALLVGSRPRGPGMERKDLLEANAAIFSAQGKALNDKASRDVKVLVAPPAGGINEGCWIGGLTNEATLDMSATAVHADPCCEWGCSAGGTAVVCADI